MRQCRGRGDSLRDEISIKTSVVAIGGINNTEGGACVLYDSGMQGSLKKNCHVLWQWQHAGDVSEAEGQEE
jgi:hypothetical protein